MPVEIKVPHLGESVVEATILRWLKQEGETVHAGDPVVELETDKVNVEVPAEQSGVLSRITKREGETVTVGDAVGILSENGTESADSRSAPTPTEPQAEKPAPANNREEKTADGERQYHATPVAQKLAAANDLDLRTVKGTGPSGKITKEDVTDLIERKGEAPVVPSTPRQSAAAPPEPSVRPVAAPTPASPPPPSTPPTAGAGAVSLEIAPNDRPVERVRMSRRRQTIATRLVKAQHDAAMLTTFNEVDMSAVMDVRKRRRDAFKERFGVNLGFMSFFTKAVVGALKSFPMLNAELQGDEIVVKRFYDVGVAVSTPEGLVVPVLRNADRKSFAEIEREIADLATRARDGKLTLAELAEGTFTITNGGVFGSLLSTPILNPPQVGILGMHKIEERPVVKNGEIVIRSMMYLALSYDHRIVDGSESVRFLVRVKELIEDPESLLLEG